jgi:hypothetical protein
MLRTDHYLIIALFLLYRPSCREKRYLVLCFSGEIERCSREINMYILFPQGYLPLFFSPGDMAKAFNLGEVLVKPSDTAAPWTSVHVERAYCES